MRRSPSGLSVDRRRRISSRSDVVDAAVARECIDLLNRTMTPFLRLIDVGIPRSSLTDMKENYSETLPKAMYVRSALLNSRRSAAALVAERIGLLRMLRSDSFRRLAEGATGASLDPDLGCQVLCYEPGHYVGPHNDHHPESDRLRRGYIDVQLTLTNSGVEHQWLVYEDKHHLQKIVSVACTSLLTIYWLPFWHYTTPLVARRGRQEDAQRWLLLGTFEFLRQRKRPGRSRQGERATGNHR
jgi:hypothetical protein